MSILTILFLSIALANSQDEWNCLQQSIRPNASQKDFEKIVALSDQILGVPCKELKVGEERILNLEHEKSPSGDEMKYLLRRKSQKEYEVVLNLDFQDKNKNLNSEFQKKLHSCLPLINTKLKGGNGEFFKISLYNGKGTAPPKVAINVSADIKRADSVNYNSNPSCGTIAHELMHLLGLIDEYQEQMGEGYDCRSVGPKDSIMHDAVSAFNATFPPVFQCECSSETCVKNIQAQYREKDCPPNSNVLPPIWHPAIFTRTDLNQYNITPQGAALISRIYSAGAINQGKKYLYVENSGRESLLYPAHFQTIIHPGCKQNLKYYHCALDAYNNSKTDGCHWSEKADFCKNQDWLK